MTGNNSEVSEKIILSLMRQRLELRRALSNIRELADTSLTNLTSALDTIITLADDALDH